MKDLTTGNIPKSIVSLAVPLIGTSFMQFANNIIDMYWVGTLGSQAISAVGVSGFYTHLIWAISSILTVGSGIEISHSLGEKNKEKAQHIARHALLATWGIALLFSLLILLYKGPLGAFFNLSGGGEFEEYITWMALGLIFTLSTNVLTSISMAFGDSKTSFRIRMIGIVINLILTPVFVYGLEMGIRGAALSTFIAQAIVALVFMLRGRTAFLGEGFRHTFDMQLFKPMVKLGFSPSVQRIIFSLASIAIGKIVAGWGPEAIAAQKIGHQIEALTFMTVGGLSGAMMTFSGQNFGAQQYARIQKGYKVTLQMALVFGVLITFLLYTQSEELMRLFVQDIKTIEIGGRYLQIVGLSQLFMITEMLTSHLINGLGKTKLPARINIVILLSRIPMALWLAQPTVLGIDGVWWTIFISTFFRGIAMLILYRVVFSKLMGSSSSILNTSTTN
ncbi:MATE family efflux transporter [Algivirga pacifica]|uniref:Multidrug-efflux transporter n=1 Tax=Algivirga pacifica TaxID=1162670 RepID=A0ABP9D8F4_9BACT